MNAADSGRPDDRHAWFRDRLDLESLGLLDEAEQIAFDEHAASCLGCRRRLELYRDNLPERPSGDRHLPPSLVARWDRSSPQLRGLERRMVRQHLDTCDVCREALVLLGFSPVLPVLADEREWRSHVLVQSTPRWKRWWYWALGPAVGAALGATAALLIVALPGIHERPAPISELPEPIPGAGADRSYRIGLAPATPDVPGFSDLTRGLAPREPAPAEVHIRITPKTSFVAFPLPMILSGSAVEFSVTRDGMELAHERREFTDLQTDGRIVFGRLDRALEPGVYRLTLVVSPAPAGGVASPDTFRTDFRLQ